MMANEQFHLKSMTAYGRGFALFPYGRLTLEIQSVNRRYLEINVNLPRLLSRFEMDIRKAVAEHIGRGSLNIIVMLKTEGAQPVSVTPNLALAKALKGAWEVLAKELKLKEELPLSLLAQEKELFLYEDEIVNEEIYQKAIHAALNEALAALLSMKLKEGQRLCQDLSGRLKQLHVEIHQIEMLTAGAPEKYRQKLQARIEELFTGNPENEERILREIAIYAERVDITEEIVRFKGHLKQFEHMVKKPLENDQETRGKVFDFLLQELLREINTVGSKAADLSIAQHVISIKSELEKIREQVQNIE